MIKNEDILKIAKLAKLSVDESELEALTKEMNRIIDFADTINQVNDEEINFDNINNLSNVFRKDEVVESFDRGEILKNVDGGEDGFFVITKRG